MASNSTGNSTMYEWDMRFHTALTVLAFIIIILNVPVVVLYFKISSLRHSAGNTFLVGLALADLLCACVMIPTGITCDLRVLEGTHHRNVCLFYWVGSHTITLASIYHIVAATIAKYFAIVYPMRNITACTKSRVNFILASIWIVSFLAGHIPFYLPYMGSQEDEIIHNYAIFLIVFAFALPTFILTCIHVHIYLRLFLHYRPGALITETDTQSENNRRIAILFFLLFLFFIVSWLPWYLLFGDFVGVISVELHDAFAILRFLAPAVNPLMFTFVKRDFRKAALSLVNGLRGRQRVFSSRRSYHTQATSSVDRTNFIEQNIERTSKVEQPEREETTVNEPEEIQII